MMKHLIVIGVVALALLTASLYLFDTNLRARLLSDADRALAARAKLIADTVDRTLQWRMTEVFTFAALPSLRGFAAFDDAMRAARAPIALAELKAILAADTNIRAVSIVDLSGQVALTTDNSMQANWGERQFVREGLAGHLFASVPSRDFGEVSQYYSAPILDNVGNVAGGLVVRVAVQEMWSALPAPPEAMLVDENGVRIVDRSDAPKPFSALVPLTSNVYAQVLLEKRYGIQTEQIPATNLTALTDAINRNKIATLSYRDEDDTLVRAAIQRMQTYPWTVVVFENEDMLLAPARDALWGAIGLSAGAVFAGALLCIALRGLGSET